MQYSDNIEELLWTPPFDVVSSLCIEKGDFVMGFRRRDGSLSRGGGNYTIGAGRRGNRKGRSPVHPPGTPLTTLMIKVTDEEYSVLTLLGAGKRVPGMRAAIAVCAKLLPLWAQDIDETRELINRHNGKQQAADLVGDLNGRLEKFLRATWDDTEPPPAPVSGDWTEHRANEVLGRDPDDVAAEAELEALPAGASNDYDGDDET